MVGRHPITVCCSDWITWSIRMIRTGMCSHCYYSSHFHSRSWLCLKWVPWRGGSYDSSLHGTAYWQTVSPFKRGDNHSECAEHRLLGVTPVVTAHLTSLYLVTLWKGRASFVQALTPLLFLATEQWSFQGLGTFAANPSLGMDGQDECSVFYVDDLIILAGSQKWAVFHAALVLLHFAGWDLQSTGRGAALTFTSYALTSQYILYSCGPWRLVFNTTVGRKWKWIQTEDIEQFS